MAFSNSKTFSFDSQHELGLKGENFFIKCYKAFSATKMSGRKNDILIKKGTVELKTDFYEMRKTPNFFIERYGDEENLKIGGPWKALEDKNDFFVYLFFKNKTFFWFKTQKLVKELDKLIKTHDFRKHRVKNHSWTTMGYLIDRQKLVGLTERIDTF